MPESFKEMIARLESERAPARAMVEEAIASGKPKLVLYNGAKKLVFSAGFDGTPYRVTSFDEAGPVGHRDYSASDIDHIIGEVQFALRNGFIRRTL